MLHVAAFYDEVLRELIAAMGAALLFGNAYALVSVAATRSASAPPRSPGHAPAARCAVRRIPSAKQELAQAPVGRTIVYMVLGFVIMVGQSRSSRFSPADGSSSSSNAGSSASARAKPTIFWMPNGRPPTAAWR